MTDYQEIIKKYRQYNLGLELLSEKLPGMSPSKMTKEFTYIETLFLKSPKSVRISDSTKKALVSRAFPGVDIYDAIKIYPAFKPVSESTGSTYLLSYEKEHGFGAVYRLSLADEDKLGMGVAADRTKRIVELVENFINSKLPSNEYYIMPEKLKRLRCNLLDAFNTDPELTEEIKGQSSDLPIFMIFLSRIIEQAIPVNFAMSGELNEYLQIIEVDGVAEKIEAVLKEYPEVDNVILPENNLFSLPQVIDNLHCNFVRNIDQIVELIFPSFQEKINQEFEGKIRFVRESRKVAINPKEKDKSKFNEISVFSLVAEPYPKNIPSSILKKLNLDNETATISQEKCKWFLLDNIRPTWYISALTTRFFNKISVLAVTNTGGANPHAIVVYNKGNTGVKEGDILYFVKEES